MNEPTYPFPTFHFHVVDRADDHSRPHLRTTKWLLTLEDAAERVRRGEWLLVVPAPGQALEITGKGTREIPLREAIDLVERLISEGKVYGVIPKPEAR